MIYEYECLECEKSYEIVRKVGDRDLPFLCPEHETQCKRIISLPAQAQFTDHETQLRLRKQRNKNYWESKKGKQETLENKVNLIKKYGTV